ncbi:MAG: chorismate synthase [bacterium]|nr:MAG: chorismate synthase [bacterium]
MAGNSFGILLRLTSFGESHGPAVGGVLDGCPSGLKISEKEIQKDLDRRKPGQSKVTTRRKEPDKIKVLSGVMESRATGAPIAFIIENLDRDTKAYKDIKDIYRPGHADYSYDEKYGLRDWRGGGRSSARETAVRVAAGAIAKMIIPNVAITGCTIRIGGVRAENFDESEIEKNPVRCPDNVAAGKMVELIEKVRKDGDSIGGIVEIRVRNVPAGLGLPVHHKLSGDLASALMGINAVKGVEIGEGFRAASMKGSAHNDEMEMATNGEVRFKTNHAGGILGGISNGNDIILRIAVKPTPSILREQSTVDNKGNETTVRVKGRHDPCICPRVVPVAEAMTALVVADHMLLQRAARI